MEKSLMKSIGERIELETIFFEEELAIMADSRGLEQVLANLVANARDAMEGKGRITIRTALAEMDGDYVKTHGYGRPGTYALLVISDTGSGMDEGTRKRLYEPFFFNQRSR